MAISQNFSPVKSSLSLNFAKSKRLDSRITFTRTTSGTYIDEDGLIKTAPAGSPRFDHNITTRECLGLLIEGAATNYLCNTPTASGGTISTGTSTAPDGTTAQKFVPTAGAVSFPQISVSNQFYSFGSIANGSSVTTVFTGYFSSVGAAGYTADIVIQVSTGNSTNLTFNELRINVTNGSTQSKIIGADCAEVIAPTYTLMPTGMYKVVWAIKYTQGTTVRDRFDFYIQCRNSAGAGSYTADGTSGFQFACLQSEINPYPTSYIPTTTAPASRTADLVSITGTNFSSFYNSLEGTFYASFIKNYLGSTDFPGVVYVDDGSISNSIGFYVNDNVNDVIGFESYVSGTNQTASFSSLAVVSGQQYKVAGSYKLNDMASSFSTDSSFQTDSSATIPTVNRLLIGQLRGSNALLHGTISQLVYYPDKLSTTQLLTLTR